MSAGSRATDPELDDALARAIRQLIAEAIEVGAVASTDDIAAGSAAGAATGTEAETGEAGSAAA